MSFDEFANVVLAAGLEPHCCSASHWQIRGGNYQVNFYSHTKKGSTFYVNGMSKGKPGKLAEAIHVARNGFRDEKRTDRCHTGRTRNAKKRMLEKDPFCHYCRRPLEWESSRIDHKIPLAAGGSNGSDNLVLACENCDITKRTRLPHAFQKAVDRQLANEAKRA